VKSEKLKVKSGGRRKRRAVRSKKQSGGRFKISRVQKFKGRMQEGRIFLRPCVAKGYAGLRSDKKRMAKMAGSFWGSKVISRYLSCSYELPDTSAGQSCSIYELRHRVSITAIKFHCSVNVSGYEIDIGGLRAFIF
jgi:hypothetical protein